MCTHTHTHANIQTHKAKAKNSSHTYPVKQWGAYALIRHYELVLANPHGEGLVSWRWGCTMPRWCMVWAPEILPGPHPLVDMNRSLTFASPVITNDFTAELAATHLYNRWTGAMWVKVSWMLTTLKWPQLGIKPTTFWLEGWCPDHLAMLAHAHTLMQTQTQTHTCII